MATKYVEFVYYVMKKSADNFNGLESNILVNVFSHKHRLNCLSSNQKILYGQI